MYHAQQKTHLTVADEWEHVRTQLRARHGDDIFEHFLKTMQLDEARSNDDNVHLTVAKRFLAKWITENYLADIQQLWTGVRGTDVVIHLADREQRKGQLASEKLIEDPFARSTRSNDFPRDRETRTVSKTLQVQTRPVHSEIEIEACREHVSKYYHVPETDIRSGMKGFWVIRARQVGIHLSRTLTTRSIGTIARKFGQSESVVRFSLRSIAVKRKFDPELEAEILHHMEVLKQNADASVS